MARFNRHRIERRQQPDGSWRCFRQGDDQGENFLVEMLAWDGDSINLAHRDGNNHKMSAICRWIKNPNRVGEWFWKTEWRSLALVEQQKIVALYFTQWKTTFEFQMS